MSIMPVDGSASLEEQWCIKQSYSTFPARSTPEEILTGELSKYCMIG